MRAQVPAHVAIIMDGNGRWAKHRRRPRHAGHQAGVKSARAVIESCVRRGVGALTLFAFSSENWRRPRTEVRRLLELFVSALSTEGRQLHENGIRLRFIGDRTAFPQSLQREMAAAETLTGANKVLQVAVAVGYGGRWELVTAARKVAADIAAGVLAPDAVDEARFASYLEAPDMPEPDLFIRTGGEQRLSNFLLWQLAYTELWFTDTLWPDFGPEEFDRALDAFAERERRFGGVDA